MTTSATDAILTFRKVTLPIDGTSTPEWNEHYGSCRLPGTDGKCVVFGGINGSTDPFLFSPKNTADADQYRTSRWSKLFLIKKQYEKSLEFVEGEPPSARLCPLMVGLTQTKFLVFGGLKLDDTTVRLTDAFMGEVVDNKQIKWLPVYSKLGSKQSASGSAFSRTQKTPFSFEESEKAPTAYSASFMRASDGKLMAVMPLLSPEFRDPSQFEKVTGRQSVGSVNVQTRMVVTVINIPVDDSDQTYTATAESVTISIPSQPTGSGGQLPWPVSHLTRVRIVPLAAGYALGTTIPVSKDISEKVDNSTWLFTVVRRDSFAGLTTDGYPNSYGDTDLAPYVIRWVNLGSLDFSPPLRHGGIIFSTGSRLNPNSRNAVVVVYGGSVVYGNGSEPRAEQPLYFATFSSGENGSTPSLTWNRPMKRLHAKQELSSKFPISSGNVIPFETFYEEEDAESEVMFKYKTLPKTDYINLAIGWHGGHGKKDVNPVTEVLYFNVPKTLINKPHQVRPGGSQQASPLTVASRVLPQNPTNVFSRNIRSQTLIPIPQALQ